MVPIRLRGLIALPISAHWIHVCAWRDWWAEAGNKSLVGILVWTQLFSWGPVREETEHAYTSEGLTNPSTFYYTLIIIKQWSIIIIGRTPSKRGYRKQQIGYMATCRAQRPVNWIHREINMTQRTTNRTQSNKTHKITQDKTRSGYSHNVWRR